MSKGISVTTQKEITANQVAAGNIYTISVAGTQANPGLQKLVAACLSEIDGGTIDQEFLRELAHFNRRISTKDLNSKLVDAGKNDA